MGFLKDRPLREGPSCGVECRVRQVKITLMPDYFEYWIYISEH